MDWAVEDSTAIWHSGQTIVPIRANSRLSSSLISVAVATVSRAPAR